MVKPLHLIFLVFLVITGISTMPAFPAIAGVAFPYCFVLLLSYATVPGLVLVSDVSLLPYYYIGIRRNLTSYLKEALIVIALTGRSNFLISGLPGLTGAGFSKPLSVKLFRIENKLNSPGNSFSGLFKQACQNNISRFPAHPFRILQIPGFTNFSRLLFPAVSVNHTFPSYSINLIAARPCLNVLITKYSNYTSKQNMLS